VTSHFTFDAVVRGLLAATAVGAVIGSAGGKLLHHKTQSKLEE
jgi:hypothetical protein